MALEIVFLEAWNLVLTKTLLYYQSIVAAVKVLERAKWAEKASCRERVVQKGVIGESVSSLLP